MCVWVNVRARCGCCVVPPPPPSEGDEKLCSICAWRWVGVVQWVSLGERMKRETSQITLDPDWLARSLKNPYLFRCIYSKYLQNAPRTVLWTKSMENFVQVRIVHTPTHYCHVYRAFKNLDQPETAVRGNHSDLYCTFSYRSNVILLYNRISIIMYFKKQIPSCAARYLKKKIPYDEYILS